MIKTCLKCNQKKSLKEFSINKGHKDGLSEKCKKCKNRYNLMLRYGKTSDELNQLFIEQNRKCALCEISHFKGKWHVDHDHKTGKVRGILCHTCNIKLYPLENDLVWLEKAQDYLYTFGA